VQEHVAKSIGNIVRAERERQELTQEELALAAGVSYRTVLQIEQGKPTSRLDVVVRVLEALGLALDVRAARRSLNLGAPMALARFAIERDSTGSYRWRLVDANGAILASATESYATRAAAMRAARHVATAAGRAEVA
jgi:y4mF family transcriptional regulator